MKANQNITEQQLKIIKYIIKWQRESGRKTIPVYQKIGDALGISKQHANVVINTLVRNGFLKIENDKYCEVKASVVREQLTPKRVNAKQIVGLEATLDAVQEFRKELDVIISNSNLSNAQKVQILEEKRLLLRGF